MKDSIVKTKVISKRFYSGVWPFKFDRCKITCMAGRMVYMEVNGKNYALNGFAHDQLKLDFPFSDELMKSEIIDGEKLFFDYSKIIDIGLRLFNKTKWSIV